MKFLRRLELQGFKSFAQKTVFEFPAQVVAIVGPNGSGKSNIIDAFRWILGEREAKHLRGDTLGNLIFAGTPMKSPAGFAKVSLYFDNSSKLFSFDAEEVMLVRKVDRSGSSQFFIHDSEIRLKELVPMLARARLGSRGLTMIGQGESDLFVRSNPEERRAMIEEVLGLREFRIKKTQAERRLESSEVNMDKVRAMIEELAPHLRLLRRQKHRWDKRSELAHELRELENYYFASHYHTLAHTLHALEGPLQKFRDAKHAEAGKITALEAKVKAIEAQGGGQGVSRELRVKIGQALERRRELERSLARLEAKMELQSHQAAKETVDVERVLHVVGDLVLDLKKILAVENISEIHGSLKAWITKLEALVDKDAKHIDESLKKEIETFGKELRVLDETIATLQRQEEAEIVREQEVNQEFRRYITELESVKNVLRSIEEEERSKLFEKEKTQLRLDELIREWRGLQRDAKELETLEIKEVKYEGDELERRMLRLRGELAAIGEIDESLVKEADETETRYGFLTRELEDLESAIKDLKKLIADLEHQIHDSFKSAFKSINEAFNTYFKLMFGGGKAKLRLEHIEIPAVQESTENEEARVLEENVMPAETLKEPRGDPELRAGVEIDLQIPRKRITSLDMLSGGEKSLVSLAALFALISVSPPPFLVLDEIDAALDEENARRFSELIKEFSKKTQFVIVTHNRATMEAADILYGVTMGEDGVSKVLSLRLEEAR